MKEREGQRIEGVPRGKRAIAPGLAEQLLEALPRSRGVDQDERRGHRENGHEQNRTEGHLSHPRPEAQAGKGQAHKDHRSERENAWILDRGRETGEERREAKKRETALQSALYRGSNARGHEEQERNIGRREVGLADMLVGDRKEEGSEQTYLGREHAGAQSSEEQNRSHAAGDGDQAADETRFERVAGDAKKSGVHVHEKAWVVEKVGIEIPGLKHLLRFAHHELFVRSNALDVEPEVDGPHSEPDREEQQRTPSQVPVHVSET